MRVGRIANAETERRNWAPINSDETRIYVLDLFVNASVFIASEHDLQRWGGHIVSRVGETFSLVLM